MLDQLKKIRARLKQQGLVRSGVVKNLAETNGDDSAVFRMAVADVEPLSPRLYVDHDRCAPLPVPKQRLADEQAALHESLHGEIALEDRFEGGDEPFYLCPGLPRRVLRDLRCGRWVIEREIDLHGCNRDGARLLLVEFLRDCLRDGHLLVRIIHGKGHGSPGRRGLLRVLVRGWLAQRCEVLAYCQARPQDGGEGALLVLLRAPPRRA